MIGAPERKLTAGGPRDAVRREQRLLALLRSSGLTAVSGGGPYPEEDRLATSSSMVRTHVHTLLDARARALVLDVTEGARGADVVEAVRYLERELKAPARFLLLADTGADAPAAPALLQCSAALDRMGLQHEALLGSLEVEELRKDLLAELAFLMERADARPRVVEAGRRFAKEKLVVFGPGGSRSTGEWLDADSLMSAFGVGVEPLRRDLLDERMALIACAEGVVADPRLQRALHRLPAALRTEEETLRDLCFFFATTDILREREATCAVFCEDVREPPARGLAWLADEEGPDGAAKDPLPAAAKGDFLTALSARALALLAGAPAGCATFAGGAATAPLVLDASTLPRTFSQATGPCTLVRLARDGRGFVFHVLETEVGERARLPVAIVRDLLGGGWPAPAAAVAPGSHGAALAELARSFAQRFRLHRPPGGIKP